MFVAISIVIVLLAAVLIFAATRPDTYGLRRATSIKAPPEKIFALINDFQRWGSWSPFEKLDPEMKRTLSGAANGVGAVYDWVGNGRAGRGRMEITDASPPSRATITVDFVKPFLARNINEFTLVAQGGVTNVTWAMQGTNPYVAKVMSVFVSMDRMVGKHFEAGLANLKAVAEGDPSVTTLPS